MTLTQITHFAKTFNKQLLHPSPKGVCLTVSSEFVEALYKKHDCASVQFGSFDDKDHCWVEVWDPTFSVIGQTLIDFTVDQFDEKLPSIIIGRVDEVFDKLPYKYISR